MEQKPATATSSTEGHQAATPVPSNPKPPLKEIRRASQIKRSASGHSLLNRSRSSSLADQDHSPSAATSGHAINYSERPKLAKRSSEAERLKKVLDRSFRLLYGHNHHGSAGSVEEDCEEESGTSGSLNTSLNSSSATAERKEGEVDDDSFEKETIATTTTTTTTTTTETAIAAGDNVIEAAETFANVEESEKESQNDAFDAKSKENNNNIIESNEFGSQYGNDVIADLNTPKKKNSIFQELGIKEPPICTSFVYPAASKYSTSGTTTSTSTSYNVCDNVTSPRLTEKSFSFDGAVSANQEVEESSNSITTSSDATANNNNIVIVNHPPPDQDDNDSSCSSSVVGALPTPPQLSKMREHIKKLQASRFTSESKRSKSSSDVTTKSSVLIRIVAETRRLEKEIKAKADEVDELREKVSQEKAENQKLRKQLNELSTNQTDTSRKLSRSQDVADKLRLENKKKAEQVEKLERNISHMEDRIRNLEIRASEVDKAELTLDSTRRNLEASQQECRAKEKEIEREREKHDSVSKELQMATLKIENLEKKLEDLKIQVRYELMKNENIERGLETIPRLKEEIGDRDKKIQELQKDVEDKALLLNASRKSAREYKEKLRELERQDVEAICIKEELEIAKSEVDTLKRLMSGKDVLVLQKCQALEQARSVMSNLRAAATSDPEKQRLRQIQNVLDQLKQIHNETSPPELRTSQKPTPHNRFAQSRPRSAMAESNRGGIDVNQHPYPPDPNNHGKENSNLENNNNSDQTQTKSSTYIFLERFLDDTEGLSNKQQQKRAKTSQGHSNNTPTASPRVHRSSSLHQLDTGVIHNSAVGSGAHTGQNSHHQHNHLHNGSASKNGGGGGGELLNRKRATSSHNIYNHHSAVSSATSPRNKNKKTTSTTTTMFVHAASTPPPPPPNVYTSEKSTKQLQYQPSLEYSLGVSTDDDLTTDTSHCQSSRNRSSERLHQNKNGEGARRPRSAFEVSKRGHSTGSDSESGSHDAYADGTGGKFTNQQLLTISRLSGSEKDSILDQVIQNGDRVSIKVNQKPPRYGRKKPKPVTYTGIVKYKGLLDSESYDARTYVGLRLDAPLGDSDGMYKGKRYMFTSKNHSKFFKIRDLDTVLDVASSIYVSTSRLILRYLERQNIRSMTTTTTGTTTTNGGGATTTTTNHKTNNSNNHNNSGPLISTPQEPIYSNGYV